MQNGYVYTDDFKLEHMHRIQHKVAKRYTACLIIPGLIIVLGLSIVVMIATAGFTREYYRDISLRNSTGYQRNETSHAMAVSIQTLIITSPILLFFYLLHLFVVIVGITLAPDKQSLLNSNPIMGDEGIQVTKEALMKYLVVVLFLPLIVFIMLIVIVLIVIVASSSKDSNCDCNMTSICLDCSCECLQSCTFIPGGYNYQYRTGWYPDTLWLFYWLMFFESRNTYYERHIHTTTIINNVNTAPVKEQPNYVLPNQQYYTSAPVNQNQPSMYVQNPNTTQQSYPAYIPFGAQQPGQQYQQLSTEQVQMDQEHIKNSIPSAPSANFK
ncbi:actin cytoskeleton-regulatory complex protein PAN [Acrasis kona]|uniref:Actin cytoskeleton-regulatory complex protein PAN n=1 Tax=Acrasis kona TaxID=1008807 RepID=A0AAW2Z725_9EUKA